MVPYHHFRVGGGFQSRRDKTDGDASLHTCRPVPETVGPNWGQWTCGLNLQRVQHEAHMSLNLFVALMWPPARMKPSIIFRV